MRESVRARACAKEGERVSERVSKRVSERVSETEREGERQRERQVKHRYCSVLQHVAVCCSVLKCVAV